LRNTLFKRLAATWGILTGLIRLRNNPFKKVAKKFSELSHQLSWIPPDPVCPEFWARTRPTAVTSSPLSVQQHHSQGVLSLLYGFGPP
jgi:hypothetical protein